MSFVKKAVKKVFKVVKKVVKKTLSFAKRVVKSDWFKVAGILALSLFTAGIAAGGFAAFNGVTTVGGFFSAVGTTVGHGITAITGMVAKAGAAMGNMFGAGAAGAGSAAGAGLSAGATATAAEAAVAGGLIADAGIGVAGIGVSGAGGLATGLAAAEATGLTLAGAGAYGSSMAAALGTAGAAAGGAAAGGGFFASLGGLLTDTGLKGTMMRGAISSGIQGYFKQKELDKQEGYYRNRTFWGQAAYGSDGMGLDLLQPSFAKASSATGAEAQGLLPYERDQLAQQEAAAAQGPTQGQQQDAMFAQGGQPPQQGLLGVPGQQTQPPPSTQPQGPGAPPPVPGSQLENMGVA